MKNFIKGWWFPLVMAGVILLVAFLLGFRITYAPELKNDWDAISAVAAWVGAIGTVAVLWYNHKTIELTQRSVRQAIDLQLYEKRLELYNKITDDLTFSAPDPPITLRIVYSEEIYQLYSEIIELCNKRWDKILEFSLVFNIIDLEVGSHGNICQELYKKYTEEIEGQIQFRKKESPTQHTKEQIAYLENHKNETNLLHKQMCEKYAQLEEKMRIILNQSMKV